MKDLHAGPRTAIVLIVFWFFDFTVLTQPASVFSTGSVISHLTFSLKWLQDCLAAASRLYVSKPKVWDLAVYRLWVYSQAVSS